MKEGLFYHDFRFLIEVVLVRTHRRIRHGPKPSGMVVGTQKFASWEVGALGAERAGHVKADVVEWKNVGKTQIESGI